MELGLELRYVQSAWDLGGRYALNKQVDVKLGVDNVFDRTYAEHLNRSNDFDPVQVQINEPGRDVWLRLSAAR